MRITGLLAAGAFAALMQAPAAPRLIGEAPPPASALSLWYRAPASDHPLLPLDAPECIRPVERTGEYSRYLTVELEPYTVAVVEIAAR